ncbi:MAG: formylmethanofuran dehydrogenase [Candidatus Lokiarchaeota archaeon]|nr:formylmethanofuran dehydrogenase [Candidatus Lokiarchaeota archaeon]
MEAKELMEKAVRFHGHICPGLAIGVLAAKYVLEQGYDYSPNEELVAIVENDNCSVDALQAILGTTFGKGNLIHQDYGKNNFTFYDRRTEKGVKLSIKISKSSDKKLTRDEKIQFLLNSKPEGIFNIYEIDFTPPGLAQIEESVPCEICGELTMNSRLMTYNNSEMCIPCYKKMRK